MPADLGKFPPGLTRSLAPSEYGPRHGGVPHPSLFQSAKAERPQRFAARPKDKVPARRDAPFIDGSMQTSGRPSQRPGRVSHADPGRLRRPPDAAPWCCVRRSGGHGARGTFAGHAQGIADCRPSRAGSVGLLTGRQRVCPELGGGRPGQSRVLDRVAVRQIGDALRGQPGGLLRAGHGQKRYREISAHVHRWDCTSRDSRGILLTSRQPRSGCPPSRRPPRRCDVRGHGVRKEPNS